MNWLKGKKTYLVAIAAIVGAVAGVATGQLPIVQAVIVIIGALEGAFLRAGVAKVGKGK